MSKSVATLTFLFGFILVFTSLKAYSELSPIQKKHQMLQQHYEQLATQSQQKMEQEQKQYQDRISSELKLANVQKYRNQLTQNSQSSCNCTDNNIKANQDPSNFYYNHQGQRISRINPPCECDKTEASSSQQSQSDSQETAKPANTQQNKSGFNIQY